MNTSTAAVRPARRRTATGPAETRVRRPDLRIVHRPAPSPYRGLLVGCAAIALATMLGILVINIGLARGSYRMSALQSEQTLLTQREQALTEDLAYRSAPQNLADRAKKLGMVPDSSVAFLRLSDGRTLGASKAARAGGTPTVKIATPSSGAGRTPGRPGSTAAAAAGTTSTADGATTSRTSAPTVSGTVAAPQQTSPGER